MPLANVALRGAAEAQRPLGVPSVEPELECRPPARNRNGYPAGGHASAVRKAILSLTAE